MGESDDDSGEQARSLEELLTWGNKDLKEWCIKRGLARSGNKPLLAKRVYRSMFVCLFVCWSLTSLCHSNGHIETIYRSMHYDDSTSGSSDEDETVHKSSLTTTEPSTCHHRQHSTDTFHGCHKLFCLPQKPISWWC